MPSSELTNKNAPIYKIKQFLEVSLKKGQFLYLFELFLQLIYLWDKIEFYNILGILSIVFVLMRFFLYMCINYLISTDFYLMKLK